MNNADLVINVVGLLYGVVLVVATFVRSHLTEAMRIDALFIRDYSEKTRPLNLVAGLLVAGYAAYALLNG